jgi:sec-independent protein translocase protein TatB
MEILGIGPAELVFIIIIALIVLGPRDMQKAGRTLGKWLRQVVTSDGWKLFQQTSREIQTLPNRLMREAALDELKDVQKDLKQAINPITQIGHSSQPASSDAPRPAQADDPKQPPASQPENTIMPPPAPPAGDEEQNA